MSNNDQSNRRQEYFQEHWEETDLSTNETSNDPILYGPESHPKNQNKFRKKKSRGNRKLQRLRAKLKKQELNKDILNDDVIVHEQVDLFY
jgi:hypothetical protein